MEGRISGGGGCCIARYTLNHGTSKSDYNYNYNSFDMSKFDNIMLRFRPIAPKPVAGGGSGGGSSGPTTPTKNDTVRKGKRKNTTTTTTTTGSKCNKRRRCTPDHYKKSQNSSTKDFKVTLPLLPETPDLSPTNKVGQTKSSSAPQWLCFGPSDKNDQTALEVVETSVLVEGVTDTWVDGNGLGCTDEERRVRLDEDTCPGFISDGWNRVWWTNKAYGNMVKGEEDTWRKESVVMVKLKGELPTVKLFPAFTCRVKVQYGKHSTMTVPCDVWRMNHGGFAWRLDIKAALCLGR